MQDKISLNQLHNTLLELSIKNEDILQKMSDRECQNYLIHNFRDKEYYFDSWYRGMIPIERLVIAHDEFRGEIKLTKNELFLAEWQNIQHNFDKKWLIPFGYFRDNKLLPVILREDERKGYYRVWDGQRRVLNALYYGLDSIYAYLYSG